MDDLDAHGYQWLVASNSESFQGWCPGRTSVVAPCIAVVPDTSSFRHLGRSLVTADDHVVEVGSCHGHCTAVLQSRAASVLAFDVSEDFLAESRRRVPGARFEFLDIFEEHGRLRAMPEAAQCTAAFVDIGGDRQLHQVLLAVGLLRGCLPRLRLLAVKSESLSAAMAAWGPRSSSAGLGDYLQQPDAFLAQVQIQNSECMTEGDNCRQKKARARCVRAAAQHMARSSPSGDSRSAVEAALGSGCTCRFGFHFLPASDIMLEMVSCASLAEHNHPLVREHRVVCAYGGATATATLLEAGKHPFPLFLGSGGFDAPCEFLGSFVCIGELQPDHRLHEDQALVLALRMLGERSRRGCPKVQLVQLQEVELSAKLGPKHPIQACGPREWKHVVQKRALLSACIRSWGSLLECHR